MSTSKNKNEIIKDLLRTANYYWYDDNDDQVGQINVEEYDPVIDKIFKANAVELEKLYAEIGESQREIILGLAQSLVPDESLLPEPGYTIAQISPKAERISTIPEDEYFIAGQSDTGDKYEYYFTPLYEHEYPKCNVVAIVNESIAIQVEDNVPEIVIESPSVKQSAAFWIGLDLAKIKEDDRIAFFVGNSIVDKFHKDYNVFHNAKWYLNGLTDHELTVERGIHGFLEDSDANDTTLLDQLGVPNNYKKRIESRFKNNFLHISLPPNLEAFKQRDPPEISNRDTFLSLTIKKPICWIKIVCDLPIASNFLVDNILYPNVIPLVNRRLIENHAVKSNYDRIVLPMKTKDLFLDVHFIRDSKNQEGNDYQRLDFLLPESGPGSYIVRSGARVQRLNQENASNQINRLLEVVQEEFGTFKEAGVNRLKQDFDIIEKAINRIKKQLPDYFREEEDQRSSYFALATFRHGVSRLHYSYWETQGENIKHLETKTKLLVRSNDVKIVKSLSLIPIQSGKDELSADDFINQVKISLLSGGRILTKGDIELYCQSRFGDLLQVVSITHELMMLQHGELGRGILVKIKAIRAISEPDLNHVLLELQNDLNAKSAFFTDIKVEHIAHA